MINQHHSFVLDQEAERFILGDWYLVGVIIMKTPCMTYFLESFVLCIYSNNYCGHPELIQDDQDCSTMGAIYCIMCLECKAELDPDVNEDPNKIGGIKSSHYLGMTNVSVHNRIRTHRVGHEREDNKNTLRKHDLEKHNGIRQEYKVVIVQKERSLLHLVMREALMIEGQSDEFSMNDKNEQGRGGIVRLHAARSGMG